MAKNDAITPEFLYYFDMETASARPQGPDENPPARRPRLSLAARIGQAIFFGLFKICLVLVAISAPLAATPADEAPEALLPLFADEMTLAKRGATQRQSGRPQARQERTTTRVNEPATLFLLGIGMLGFALIARRHVAPNPSEGGW